MPWPAHTVPCHIAVRMLAQACVTCVHTHIPAPHPCHALGTHGHAHAPCTHAQSSNCFYTYNVYVLVGGLLHSLDTCIGMRHAALSTARKGTGHCKKIHRVVGAFARYSTNAANVYICVHALLALRSQ
jgi:hypothetical protein